MQHASFASLQACPAGKQQYPCRHSAWGGTAFAPQQSAASVHSAESFGIPVIVSIVAVAIEQQTLAYGSQLPVSHWLPAVHVMPVFWTHVPPFGSLHVADAQQGRCASHAWPASRQLFELKG